MTFVYYDNHGSQVGNTSIITARKVTKTQSALDLIVMVVLSGKNCQTKNYKLYLSKPFEVFKLYFKKNYTKYLNLVNTLN